MTTALFPHKLADEYLALKAKQADLKRTEQKLKDTIIATGERVLEGELGRVVVSDVDDTPIINWKEAFYGLVPKTRHKMAARYATMRAGHYAFRVTARNPKAQKAA